MAAATSTQEVAVSLSPEIRGRVLKAFQEHQQLAESIAAAKLRQEALKVEVEELFAAADEGNALFHGCKLDGWAVKMVCGETTKLDEDDLMKTHGLSAVELDACRVTSANTPYVKITAPRKAK